MKGKRHSEEAKKKNSDAHKGRPSWNKGKPATWATGSNNVNWKGGVSRINKTERQLAMETPPYKNWRRAVFERDNFTCVHCHVRGVRLHADHIKPWVLFPSLRFEVTNGQTLCVDCHKVTDTYGSKAFSKSPQSLSGLALASET